jgi:hypothetical protein
MLFNGKTWFLKRTIDDENGKLQFVYGTVKFTSINENNVLYTESGTNNLNQAYEQNYVYELVSEKVMQVWLFDSINKSKTNLYFTFNPTLLGINQAPPSPHYCGQDTYYITICLIDQNQYTIKYKVKGPNKNYTIHNVINNRDIR